MASSVFQNNVTNYGPDFAIDRRWSSTANKQLYVSKAENMPWFQLTLPEITNVIGVSISDEAKPTPMKPMRLEARAGMVLLENEFKGRILINQICGGVEEEGPC